MGVPAGGWVGIAANPHSGAGRARRRVEGLTAALETLGLRPRIGWTPQARGELVAAARADCDCRALVAVGGDGTVASLINERPTVPITVLPTGTENLFARYFRLGARPEAVAAAIVAGQTVTLDLGQARGRRFALMAGIGFDADVITRHHAARERTSGRPRTTNRAAYVEPILRASMGYRFPRLVVDVIDDANGETIEGRTAFIFNLPSYALGLPVVPTAVADDGLLDLVVFSEPGPFRALHYLWLVLRGLHLRRPGVVHRRVRRVEVRADETIPVQLDGDPGGLVNGHVEAWSAEVLPRAIEVIVPAHRNPLAKLAHPL
jgi:diacylglycerol kinase family enzyme